MNCTVTSEPCCPVGDSCIGGLVAEDIGGDGLGGPNGDIGIPLVATTLIDESGNPFATTVTDSNGCFAFDTAGLGPLVTTTSFTVVVTKDPNGMNSDLDGGDPNAITFPHPGGGVDPTNYCLWFLSS